MMVYDCFSFFNELDLLEVRLNILDLVVDKFVLVEATQTFTGNDKPLYYEENKERYAKFNDKIIHIVVDDFPTGATPWERENWQRNAISRALTGAAPDDAILVSDLDEIPRPEAVARERNTKGLKRFLQSMHYCYFNYLNWTNPVWPQGTYMIPFGEIEAIDLSRMPKDSVCVCASVNAGNTFTRLRLCEGAVRQRYIRDGGWHFSFLMTTQAIIHKIRSYAETQMATPENTSVEAIEKRIREGRNLFCERNDRFFAMPINTNHYPEYVRNNVEKLRQYIYPVTSAYLRDTRLSRWRVWFVRVIRDGFVGVRRFGGRLLPPRLLRAAQYLYAKVFG